MLAEFTAPQLGGGLLAIAFYLFVFLIAVLWLLLPFAVFGIKPILKNILFELRETKMDHRRRTRRID